MVSTRTKESCAASLCNFIWPVTLSVGRKRNNMLLNDLRPYELDELIGSFLTLKSIDKIFAILSRYYDQEIKSRNDIYKQSRVKLAYKGFDLQIRDIRRSKLGLTSLIAQFKKRENIWDKILKKATRKIVNDLKKICQDSISDLEFSIFSYTPQLENYTLLYHYDKKALNQNWQSGYEISPLLIASDAHHGNCFVEFLFNADCYMKTKDGAIKLSPTWYSNICNISKGIEEDAKKLLGAER